MSYKKVNLFGKDIKINTICACGALLASPAMLYHADIAHDNNKGKPFIQVVEGREADAGQHEDPNALAALTFAAAAALFVQKLAEKENEKDNRKVMNRFIANFKDGMSF